MAYAVFDRVYNNQMVSGLFTNKESADDFLIIYADEEDYANLYVDRVCQLHETDEAESVCQCNYYDPRDI